MRELFLKQALSLVDRFISPSAFLKQRFVAWGLPAERIEIVANGIAAAPPAPHRPLAAGGARNRFAYFGHLNPFKGALVAIEAARRLSADAAAPFSLALHGSAEFQTDAFKAELAAALAAAPMVRASGRYRRDDLPGLIAEADWVVVPSIWWENAPLVIAEAFRHGRPVICSNIGGMAEAVRDGVDGLWFRAGDPAHLAERMEEAMSADLWNRLVAGIHPSRSLAEAADDHAAFYARLVDERAATMSEPASVKAAPTASRRRSRRRTAA